MRRVQDQNRGDLKACWNPTNAMARPGPMTYDKSVQVVKTPKTPSSSLPGQIARALLVLMFLAIWMAAGWLLKLDPNQYLLLGVPLTVLFQMGVVRRPLRSLWVRSAPPMRTDAK